LIGVGCWSHARRKFVEALEQRPGPAAEEIVSEIRKLYLVERHARERIQSAAQQGATQIQNALSSLFRPKHA
jgi:hypothetical protein